MFHKEGAYDGFDSLKEVRPHYKRYRKTQSFILSDKAVKSGKIICMSCKKPLNEKDGNRCEFYPKEDLIITQCYVCAWTSLLSDVYKLADKLGY